MSSISYQLFSIEKHKGNKINKVQILILAIIIFSNVLKHSVFVQLFFSPVEGCSQTNEPFDVYSI